MNGINQNQSLTYSHTPARHYSGGNDGVVVRENGRSRPLSPRIGPDADSQSDFAWGSTSPAGKRLALALLADALEDERRASDWAELFSARVIAILPERWTMTRERVLSYVDLIARQKMNETFVEAPLIKKTNPA